MSQSTEQKPLTMSAEQLQQIVKLAYGYNDRALLELLKELDARAAAVKLGVDCVDCEEMTPAQTWHASVQAIKVLRERLEQAQRDTERLDWLAAQNEFDIWSACAEAGDGKVRLSRDDKHGGPDGGEYFKGATLREAIDAAMEANTKALRTKPDQVLRPAESGDTDAVGFEGGKPNE